MFHVYDDVIVAGMASNFGENRGEAAEEESIESFAFSETGFDGIAVAGCMLGWFAEPVLGKKQGSKGSGRGR